MATRRGRLRAALPLSTARPWRATPKIRAKHVCQCDLTALALQGVQLWSVAYGTDSFLGAALRSRESLLSCFARIDSQCGARGPLEALGSLLFYVLNVAPMAGTLATKSYVSVLLNQGAPITTASLMVGSLVILVAYLLTFSLAGAARANTFVPKLTSKCRPWRAAALDSPLWVLVATARTRTSECRA